MAERGYAFIKKIPLFTSQSLSAGGSGTSTAIDLTECTQEGRFSIAASIALGTAGTCGTTTLSYTGCETADGTFVSPASAVTLGTLGTSNTADIIGFTPVLTPFIKIIAAQNGSGNVGHDSVITATLNVQ
jgi:hypothetical protein